MLRQLKDISIIHCVVHISQWRLLDAYSMSPHGTQPSCTLLEGVCGDQSQVRWKTSAIDRFISPVRKNMIH